MLSIATVCSGIGSPEQAIKDLNIEHDITFACEIDNWARKSYLANHGCKTMYTDMTKEDWVGPSYYADLFVGGIPCQSFSLAGKRLGEADKRGLLFYDFYRYVKNQQPKVFIIENVRGLLSDNNGKTFQNWCSLLGQSMNTHINMFNHEDSLLYNLHFKILNSTDYGIPQKRERVFLVGIRNDLPNTFRFPKAEKLKLRLIDLLEQNIDEKYYLSDNMLQYLSANMDRTRIINDKFDVSPCILANQVKVGTDAVLLKVAQLPGFESSGRVYSEQGLAPTLKAKQQGLIMVSEGTKKGYAEVNVGDSVNLSFPKSKTRRGRVGKEKAQTLDTQCNQGVFDGYRIRKYTPLECMRLQGFPDSFIKPCSDFQTYKQAGNSITVNVMKAVINQLLPIF
jgi:DNA (cytosine-5)-methyltransferase 1